MIDEVIIYDYLYCKYKALLRNNHEIGTKHCLEKFEEEAINRTKGIVLPALFDADNIVDLEGFTFSKKRIENYSVIKNTVFEHNSFHLKLNLLRKKIGDDKYSYSLLFFIPVRKIDKIIKIYTSICQRISSYRFKEISSESIVYYNGSETPVQINSELFRKDTDSYISEIPSLFRKSETPLILSQKCFLCEYHSNCLELAKKQDNLSLIKGLTSKTIVELNKKGIFTVHQYSFTFRPRKKRKKSTVFLKKHHHALQALAIRTNKTYVYSTISVNSPKNKIFIDLEYLPEDKYIYLIGIVISHGKNITTHSIWINDSSEYLSKVECFLDIIATFKNFHVYYYGQTEKIFLESITNLNVKKQSIAEKVIKNSTNVLSLIYGNIYFPTYSNSLKVICNYLGVSWSEKNATGLDAMYWRRCWLLNHSESTKGKLIQYNIEDCFALKEITQFLVAVYNRNVKKYKNIIISSSESDDLPSRYGEYEFGSQKFANDDFEYVNQFAYFDYQHDKVYIRTNKNSQKRKIHNKELKIPINKIVKVRRSRVCPRCKSNNLRTAIRRDSKSRVVIDLKFFKGGLKRWNIKYIANYQNCQECRNVFFPQTFVEKRGKYGHNLISWVIYQSVVNFVSYDKITAMLKDVFQYDYKFNYCDFSKLAFGFYSYTLNDLKRNILKGDILHIDETKVSTRVGNGYVWVFTNMNTVYYLFRKDRKTDFLKELLKDFEGVMISDFYKGYDALDCIHQKCLIHLMRDVNKILFKNQQDASIKCLADNFGKLLRIIIQTIDKYGLKKRYLKKHKKDVELFYEKLGEIVTQNPDINALIKRFYRYKASLFSFLNFDGVPWNNNNAEHGFTHFAIYRRQAKGLFTAQSIERYLCFLSIYQTCRYRELSFLHFLRSKEKIVSNYQKKYNQDGERKKAHNNV